MAEIEDDSRLVQFWLQQQQRERRTFSRRDRVLGAVRRLARAQDRILNLGCGVGAYSYYLSQELAGARIVSLDISHNCLKLGIERYDITTPVMANALYIPFSDKTFDIVVFSEVIEHIVEQEQLLGEIGRVTADGGHLVLTTSPIKSDLLYSVVQLLKRWHLFGLHLEQEHVAVQHPADIRRRLEGCGFSLLQVSYWNVLHLRSMNFLMNIPLLGTLIERVDDRLGFLSRLCTDFACIARKEGGVDAAGG